MRRDSVRCVRLLLRPFLPWCLENASKPGRSRAPNLPGEEGSYPAAAAGAGEPLGQNEHHHRLKPTATAEHFRPSRDSGARLAPQDVKLLRGFAHLLYVGNIRQLAAAKHWSSNVRADRENTRSLSHLYSLYARDLGRLAYLLLGDPHLAQDLVNETYIRVAGHLWKLRDPAAIHSYLRKTLLNLARAHGRRRATEERANARYASTSEGQPEPAPGDYVERGRLIDAVNRLPHRQKAAFLLRYYEDLSEHQVADLLELPIGTVKTLAFRARQTLRAELENRS